MSFISDIPHIRECETCGVQLVNNEECTLCAGTAGVDCEPPTAVRGCECEHAKHFSGAAHAYGTVVATHLSTTAWGKFHVCKDCITCLSLYTKGEIVSLETGDPAQEDHNPASAPGSDIPPASQTEGD